MLAHSHLDCLKRTTFFGMLPPDVLEELIPSAQVSSYRQGEAVYQQGDTSRAVFCVASGAIKLTVDRQNGTEVVVDIFHPEIQHFQDQLQQIGLQNTLNYHPLPKGSNPYFSIQFQTLFNPVL